MALTGRTGLLALLGIVPVALMPGWASVLGWAAVVLAAVGVDVLLAGSPRGLAIERAPLAAIRLGETVSADLVLANRGRRRVHGVIRDGWQPSAGAEPSGRGVRGQSPAALGQSARTSCRRGRAFSAATTGS